MRQFNSAGKVKGEGVFTMARQVDRGMIPDGPEGERQGQRLERWLRGLPSSPILTARRHTPTTRGMMADNNKYDLDIEQIEEIVAKGIEYGVVDDEFDISSSPLTTATEVIDFCLEVWGEDIVDEDDKDPAVSMAGAQIMEMLRIAKVAA